MIKDIKYFICKMLSNNFINLALSLLEEEFNVQKELHNTQRSV